MDSRSYGRIHAYQPTGAEVEEEAMATTTARAEVEEAALATVTVRVEAAVPAEAAPVAAPVSASATGARSGAASANALSGAATATNQSGVGSAIAPSGVGSATGIFRSNDHISYQVVTSTDRVAMNYIKSSSRLPIFSNIITAALATSSICLLSVARLPGRADGLSAAGGRPAPDLFDDPPVVNITYMGIPRKATRSSVSSHSI